MNHGEKKIAKIIEELTMYFFTMGATHMESGITIREQTVTIQFRSDYESPYREDLNKLGEYLNEPKNEGIEDFYWELAGSGDPGETSQLLLVGMMIDSAEVDITDTEVTLTLYKKLKEQ
ncbi:MAG: hypothetical protein NC081_00085 [Roseburia sp.]|nr:hypothetical protein [Roseburia sp.]